MRCAKACSDHATLPFSSLLVVAPHPDDETLAVGGAIHRVAREGGRVDVAVCVVPGEDRLAELKVARDALRVNDVHLLVTTTGENTPGRQYLDTVPQATLIDWVDGLVQAGSYDAVVLPPPFGFHQEHRAVAAATLAALRPTAGTYRHAPRFVAHYEHSADHWGPLPAEQPNFYVALTDDDMTAKSEALAAHGSQVRPAPSERCWASLEALGRMRGMQAGVAWAEALVVRRMLS